jgi:hypothetical protein
MRIIGVLIPVAMVAGSVIMLGIHFSQNANSTFTTVGQKVGSAAGGIGGASTKERHHSSQEVAVAFKAIPQAAENVGDLGGQLEKAKAPDQPEQKDRVDKPRKIRYTADMKLVVDKLDDAEEALDAARNEAKGEYEKAEVNRSANVVRNGMWRVRVPNENLNSFRKAVAKLGEVERDTIESEDMTAKYYDLDAHITNRKAEQKATREFLIEIGKKDARYMEIKRELDTISDDINRKEGMFKLWTNLTELTTFTINMREKQPYAPTVVKDVADPPPFSERVNTSWDASWAVFTTFCQRIVIAAIWVAPWLPIALVVLGGVWLSARRLGRASTSKPPVVVAVAVAPAESI